MPTTDFDTLGTEIVQLFGSTVHAGSVWQAWQHAKDTDWSEWSDWSWSWFGDNKREMESYYNDQVENAERAWTNLHAIWLTTFNPSVHHVPILRDKTESWLDEINSPLRNEGFQLQTGSRVRESWYGESAQKYEQALSTQVAAVEEFFTLTGTVATETNNANTVLKGVLLMLRESVTPIKDKLNGASKEGGFFGTMFNPTYFENVAYGRAQFEGLEQWLRNEANNGSWQRNLTGVKRNLEDARIRVTSLSSGWPASTTGNMQDMENGHVEGANPATNTPYQPGQTPEVDPNAEPGETGGGYEQQEYEGGMNNKTEVNQTVDPTVPDQS